MWGKNVSWNPVKHRNSVAGRYHPSRLPSQPVDLVHGCLPSRVQDSCRQDEGPMEMSLPILAPPDKKKETFPRSVAADFTTSLIGRKVTRYTNAPWNLGHCPGTQNYPYSVRVRPLRIYPPMGDDVWHEKERGSGQIIMEARKYRESLGFFQEEIDERKMVCD